MSYMGRRLNLNPRTHFAIFPGVQRRGVVREELPGGEFQIMSPSQRVKR